MAISQKQIQERAFRLAVSLGLDPHTSNVIDNAFAFEDAFPLALRQAVESCRDNEGEIQKAKREYQITFLNGIGDLPDTVIDSLLEYSEMYQKGDPDLRYNASLQTSSDRYEHPANPQLAHYYIHGTELHYREPNGITGDYTGAAYLYTPGMPDVPAVITDPIVYPTFAGTADISTYLAERTIQILAQMVRGGASA